MYQEFNQFQNAFYLSKQMFGDFTRFEIAKHGYTLLNNLAKGFPNLAESILNLKGIGWSGPTSHAILIALQNRFYPKYSVSGRVPQFIYFKNNKESSKSKTEKQEDAEIIRAVCNTYIIDTKTFETLKNTDKISLFVAQLKGDFEQVKKIKKKKK